MVCWDRFNNSSSISPVPLRNFAKVQPTSARSKLKSTIKTHNFPILFLVYIIITICCNSDRGYYRNSTPHPVQSTRCPTVFLSPPPPSTSIPRHTHAQTQRSTIFLGFRQFQNSIFPQKSSLRFGVSDTFESDWDRSLIGVS